MFFRRRRADSPSASTVNDELLGIVREHLPDEADEEEVCILAAVAALVACVAYADGVYHADEVRAVRRMFDRVHDLPPRGVEAMMALLDERIADLARGEVHEHARLLKQGLTREARAEVLDVLMDVAAADGQISILETELLRRITNLMGLDPNDYVHAQSRHRDKLAVLQGD